MRVLFLGKGGDCRTLLAEAIFNHLAPPGWTARRESCDRACPPDAAALAFLAKQGTPSGRSASDPSQTDPFEEDVLITVCSVGAEQVCPGCRHAALRAHWSVHIPSRRVSTPTRGADLLDIHHILRVRIERLLDLIQAGRVTGDPARFQHELTLLGRYLPKAPCVAWPEGTRNAAGTVRRRAGSAVRRGARHTCDRLERRTIRRAARTLQTAAGCATSAAAAFWPQFPSRSRRRVD